MTPEQIEKANWLSGLYAAVANGETLQVHEEGEWRAVIYASPNLQSNQERWRIKPKPQKAWVVWCPSMLVPIVSVDEEVAKKDAAKYGGTIQEITRPDK